MLEYIKSFLTDKEFRPITIAYGSVIIVAILVFILK